MTVSICIPTYNGREHLAECVACIQAQSFTDFEVVICDDQSPDGTLDYARELAGDDPRFRFIANPHRLGLVGNWNNCVEQARGEWIKFVFQDDLISPSCLEKLLGACRREQRLFAFCERDLIFEDGVSISMRDGMVWHQQKVRSNYQGKSTIEAREAAELALARSSYNPVGEPTVTLIHRSVFAELGGFDPAFIQVCDSEFWCRVMTNYGAAFLPETLATFRVHESATTAHNFGSRWFRMQVLDPLALRYLIAFGRHFRRARSLRPKSEKWILRLICIAKAGSAWQEVREGQEGDRRGDLRKEWDELTAYYPGLRALAFVGRRIGFLQRVAAAVGLLR